MLTPEQIAEKADHLDGIANIRAINKEFRMQDTSNLWPIRGRFNVTERAIRQARKQDCKGYGLEYANLLDKLISDIVNDPKNM
jgi:hypothetical protein